MARVEGTLEEFLRHFDISPRQDDREDHLDLAEIAIDNAINPRSTPALATHRFS